MGSGVQVYSKTGELIFDSTVHNVMKLFKKHNFTNKDWTFNYSAMNATLPVPDVAEGKHICLPFGDFSGSTPLIFTVDVKNGYVLLNDTVGYLTNIQGNYTIYIMEIN